MFISYNMQRLLSVFIFSMVTVLGTYFNYIPLYNKDFKHVFKRENIFILFILLFKIVNITLNYLYFLKQGWIVDKQFLGEKAIRSTRKSKTID